jgi:hypothetical protein
VVALVLSFVIAMGGFAAMVAYGKRRPVGAPLSWGEAMLGASLIFGLMFWAYGVVPHQWLLYAENELTWRSDKILVGWGLPLTGNEGLLEYFLPFTVSYETLSHIIAVSIYGLFLGMHVAGWAIWQDRAKQKPVELTSGYGRPLVKQG